MAKKSLYNRTDKKIQRIAGTIGAIMTIIGAVAGVCSWASNQFANAVSSQISSFQEEVRASDKADKQATTRIELMVLMNHDPDNVVAIERMAKYYFQGLDGDLYMTQQVSDWCIVHGRDCTAIIGGK